MISRDRKFAVLAVAVATLLTQAGCQRASDQTAAEAKPPARAWALDESKLTPPIRFQSADLDPSIGACTDLAAHANDKWLAANPIPADQISWGAGSVLRERSLDIRRQIAEHVAGLPDATGTDKIVGDLWRSGMNQARVNEQGIKPLATRLAEIDGLADGTAVSAYLRKVAAEGLNPLFSFGPEADFKDSKTNIAYAVQGGLGLPDKTYYFDADKKSIREAYQKHVAKVLELSGVAATDAATQATAVLAFETRLARASKSQEDLSRDVELYYNPVAPAKADELAPNFPWTAFFESQGIATPAMFSLSVPSFHKEVSTMIGTVPVAEWKSYLRYHLVDDASPYLSDAFATEHFEFHDRTLLGQKEIQARWKRVLGAVEDGVGEAMGQLYVKVAFPPSSKEAMERLVGNLAASLKVRIENLAWMTDETKKKALAKLATFTPKVGYPDKWRDWSGLATSGEDYLGNVYAARAFNYRWELGKVGQPVDRTEWDMTPQTVNAYYNPLQNEIVFPAAILQPPFFDPSVDDPLNYGAIGAVIGHEMTHGFDDQGSRFGPDGNFEQWWSDVDAAQFRKLTARLVKQYDAYEALPGLKVNGNLTLGENIADLGGLSVAYDAMGLASAGKPDPMIDGMTRDQRFFYGWSTTWRSQQTAERARVLVASDPHSPPRVRANAPPTNVPAFATAFDCKPGDPMLRKGDALVVIW